MHTVRIVTRPRLGSSTMHGLVLIGIASSMAACVLEPGPEGATEGTGSTETAAASDTEGPDLPDCEPGDETVTAEFSLTVDGMPIELDYSDSNVSISGVPEGWESGDTEPEIDGACQVVESTPGSVALLCDDTMGVSRTVDLAFSSSPALAPELAAGEVQLHYFLRIATDELDHEPDTGTQSFVLWTDAGVLLAGIDGRFSVYSSVDAAWPADVLSCSVEAPECAQQGRGSVTIETGDDEGTTLDGNAVPVGDLLAVVEQARRQGSPPDDDVEDVGKTTLRLLVGPPA